MAITEKPFSAVAIAQPCKGGRWESFVLVNGTDRLWVATHPTRDKAVARVAKLVSQGHP